LSICSLSGSLPLGEIKILSCLVLLRVLGVFDC
jgi:hypothetical protein